MNMRSHVKLYVAFAQGFGLPDFPATLNSLQAFAEFLLQSVQAPKSVFNALASIKHAHKDLLLPVNEDLEATSFFFFWIQIFLKIFEWV